MGSIQTLFSVCTTGRDAARISACHFPATTLCLVRPLASRPIAALTSNAGSAAVDSFETAGFPPLPTGPEARWLAPQPRTAPNVDTITNPTIFLAVTNSSSRSDEPSLVLQAHGDGNEARPSGLHSSTPKP